ncbi:MAG: SAM-dependent methyltransferase, partial [Myxococcota bacterium]
MSGLDPRDRFTVTVDRYQKFRPDYPPALFDWLSRSTARGWLAGAVTGRRAVDLGAGTGIFSRLLAARGWDAVS